MRRAGGRVPESSVTNSPGGRFHFTTNADPVGKAGRSSGRFTNSERKGDCGGVAALEDGAGRVLRPSTFGAMKLRQMRGTRLSWLPTLFHPNDKDLPLGTPIVTPTTKTCLWGPRFRRKKRKGWGTGRLLTIP